MPFRRLVHLHICGFACMLMRLLACLQSNVPACVSADLHICGYACTEIGRLADLSACKVKGIFPYPYRFGVWWQLLAASGREWLRSCHVFKGLNALPLHPSGRAMLPARTAAPGSVLLLGSRRVSGDRYLYGIVITGISPIRLLRIFVSSKTQQGMFRVTRNLAGYSRKPCP